MNFKRYHVSKNLFDKDTATIYEATISSNGSWTSGSGATVRIPVVPSTTYTLHTNNIQSVFRITEIASDNLPPVSGNLIIRSSNINSYTFTTSENANYIVFQAGVDTTQQWISELMLNEGSTALPYEPYSSEVWHDTPHYIHNTSTDTLTTPADIYANDTTATVGLKGQMEQTGTPSPTTPIQPQECGERTGNLFDATTAKYGYYINASGNEAQSSTSSTWSRLNHTDYIPISAGDKYTYHYTNENPSSETVLQTIALCWFDSTKAFISRETMSVSTSNIEQTLTGTAPNNAAYLIVNFTFYNHTAKYMLNVGDTALPYEPYGIKIPISSANTTTPVYLGEVQTTRKVKKLVLTGEENITSGHLDVNLFNIPVSDYLKQSAITCISTHYISQSNVNGWADVNDKSATFYGNTGSATKTMYIRDSAYTTVADFKAYLAAQYAAGTPVTVWYVLAEPTTGIVNEPLRKIGDYADEVSGITIPTTAGANTISVDTTLQPSEVTATYKGWHPVVDVHERESGQWD